MPTGLKLSKAKISKIIQSGGYVGSLLRSLVGPLVKIAIPLAKNILAPLVITAATSAIDAGILKKIHVQVVLRLPTLIILNKVMNDIIKIDQALKDSTILLKGVTETIKNQTKEQKGRFLGTLVCTLGSILLGNLLPRKGIKRADYGYSSSSALCNNQGQGITRAGYGSKKIFFLSPVHPLANIKVSEYY